MMGSLFSLFLSSTPQTACKYFASGMAVVFLGATVTACGGSGSSAAQPLNESGSQSVDNADLLISLTDAEGDFLSYSVDVSSINLTHMNGTTVSVLPETTTVDFAQYVDVSELLTVASVPYGKYVSAQFSLDFSNAQVTVQDADGSAINALVVDETGDVASTLDVSLVFNGDNDFVLRPGAVTHLTLDFDLDASNEIVIDAGTAIVTVQPVLLADTLQTDPKPVRLRGLLGEVSVEEGIFEMLLRPFRKRTGHFGGIRVNVDSETAYEVNGEVIATEEGLTALAELDAASPLVVASAWSEELEKFVATDIYAGSSVPWGDADILRGTVVGRNGNEIAVRGGVVELADGRFHFRDTISLTVGDETSINKRGEDATLVDISVGSAVHVIGVYSGDSTMDASSGVVRIHQSNITGTAVNEDPLVVDLQLVNGRRASLFDFSGTGVTSEDDADSDNYEVETSTLDLSGILNGDPLRVRGFVAAYGSAPADFDANSVRDAATVKGVYTIGFGEEGSVDAFVSVDADGIVIDSVDVSRAHHILRAGIAIDVLDLEQMPIITPAGERGIYSITIGRRVDLYTDFASFVTAVNASIDALLPVIRVDAQGVFDAATNEFSSKRLRIHFNEAVNESNET